MHSYAHPAAPAAQATDLATLSPAEQAAALGYPATMFGLTPEDADYWREPGLPWLTAAQMHDDMPLDYRGFKMLLCVGYLNGDQMAPRFPNGCGVQTAPMFDKSNLAVGRVYTYQYRHGETGEWEYEMGRLLKIGGNYLEAKADNRPTPSIWLLRDEPEKAVWDVREVTHYVSHPNEQEGAARE